MMITVMMLLAVLTNIRHDAGDCSWLITFCLATSQTCPGPLAKIFGRRLVATGQMARAICLRSVIFVD